MDKFLAQVRERLALHEQYYGDDLENQKLVSIFLGECYDLACSTQQCESDDLYKQISILLKNKLNKPKRLNVLKDQLHRKMIIELCRMGGIQHYSYSYFNQAKLSQKHLIYLKQIGPYLFVEAVMLVSKLNVINKNYSRIMTEDYLYNYKIEENEQTSKVRKIEESPLDVKINRILKLCDGKKRSINNNLNKLEALLEDEDDRLQLIKQLGKILRDSWKKEKNIRKNDSKKQKAESQVTPKPQAKRPWIQQRKQPNSLIQLQQQDSQMVLQQKKKRSVFGDYSQVFEPSFEEVSYLQKQASINLLSVKSFSLHSSVWEQGSHYMGDFI